MVTGYWLKVKKPETTNQRPETKSLNKSGKGVRYAKVSKALSKIHPYSNPE